MSNALERAISTAGGMTRLAEAVGATVQVVSNWKARGVPSERCPDIERATQGQVIADELRPDVQWARVPDATWPHPQGRPCIDVAAEQATSA